MNLTDDEVDLLLCTCDRPAEGRPHSSVCNRTRGVTAMMNDDRILTAVASIIETRLEAQRPGAVTAELVDAGCTCHRSAVAPCIVHGELREQARRLLLRLDTDRNHPARSDLYDALKRFEQACVLDDRIEGWTPGRSRAASR